MWWQSYNFLQPVVSCSTYVLHRGHPRLVSSIISTQSFAVIYWSLCPPLAGRFGHGNQYLGMVFWIGGGSGAGGWLTSSSTYYGWKSWLWFYVDVIFHPFSDNGFKVLKFSFRSQYWTQLVVDSHPSVYKSLPGYVELVGWCLELRSACLTLIFNANIIRFSCLDNSSLLYFDSWE